MKKNYQQSKQSNSDVSSNKIYETDKIKTTNVNILLNRVRLDNKRVFIKRLILSGTIILSVSLIFVFVII